MHKTNNQNPNKDIPNNKSVEDNNNNNQTNKSRQKNYLEKR